MWGSSASSVFGFGHRGLLRYALDHGTTWRTLPVTGGGHVSSWRANITAMWADGSDMFLLLGRHLALSVDRGKTWEFVQTPFLARKHHITPAGGGGLLLTAFNGDIVRFDYKCSR